MIDPKELRIGNWLRHKAVWSYRNDGGPAFNFQVESMDFYATHECTFHFNNAAPILLTKHWLDKFGFKINLNIDGEEIMGVPGTPFFIEYMEFMDAAECGYYFYSESILQGHRRIKYVHQLQNLYFALTSEELIQD